MTPEERELVMALVKLPGKPERLAPSEFQGWPARTMGSPSASAFWKPQSVVVMQSTSNWL